MGIVAVDGQMNERVYCHHGRLTVRIVSVLYQTQHLPLSQGMASFNLTKERGWVQGQRRVSKRLRTSRNRISRQATQARGRLAVDTKVRE